MPNRLSHRRLPFRVLPVMLLAVLLMLTVKVTDVWNGFASLAVQVTTAQAQAQGQPTSTKADQKAGVPRAADQKAEAGPAMGQAAATGPGAKKSGEAQVATATPLPTAELPRDPTRFNQSEIDLLQALGQRRDALDLRERALDQREALLKAAEKRFEEKVADLDAVKLELQGMLARNNEQEDARLRSLVKIYESMKPKEAALIFDKLEINVLLGVIERMKENKVAPILASMQPDRARQVTDMLADKSQRPPPRR
jgi:flagellar motility protein MotE (MotC chaperone)